MKFIILLISLSEMSASGKICGNYVYVILIPFEMIASEK